MCRDIHIQRLVFPKSMSMGKTQNGIRPSPLKWDRADEINSAIANCNELLNPHICDLEAVDSDSAIAIVVNV